MGLVKIKTNDFVGHYWTRKPVSQSENCLRLGHSKNKFEELDDFLFPNEFLPAKLPIFVGRLGFETPFSLVFLEPAPAAEPEFSLEQ